MQQPDDPVVDIHTLRRDLYLLASLLLADKQMAEMKVLDTWTFSHYETEVNRLTIWLAAAMRGLLDLQRPQYEAPGAESCGEYWGDFPSGKTRALTFRQACNSMIHAKQIYPYQFSKEELDTRAGAAKRNGRKTYDGIVTIRGVHRNLQTRADVDVIAFVKIADRLTMLHGGNNHADR